MKSPKLLVALHDTSRGYEINPTRVPMSVLRDFMRDVEILLRGDGRQVDTNALEVSVVVGSLGVLSHPFSNPLASPDLLDDLRSLIQSPFIDTLKGKRKDVIVKWQKLARSSREIVIKITSDALPRAITIDSNSDYRSDDADHWVAVERYLRGEIFDLGGQNEANAHIRLPDGTKLTVSTQRETLRTDQFNRLYKPSMVRIKAEYNVLTREYRKASLLEFIEHDESFDSEAIDAAIVRLTQRGSPAWKDVADPSHWVDDLRGSSV